MRAFLVTFVIVILVLAGTAYWLWRNADRLPEGSLIRTVAQLLRGQPADEPSPTPEDYHLLQSLGGVPFGEAARAGLRGEDYAYLRSFEPIQASDGVQTRNGVTVRGKPYDLCFEFETRHPREQHLEFNIGGAWDELHFGCGFDDGHPSDPEGQWSIELEIKADGELILGPTELTPNVEPFFGSVRVKGVNRVTFTSRRNGYQNPFCPLLIDPFLKRLPEQAAAGQNKSG
jgi:hypothetical protein